MDHNNNNHHKMYGGMGHTTMKKCHDFMHMTFFWGTKSEVLFAQWPGDSHVMYALALLLVFLMSFLLEWLSHTRFIKPGSKSIVTGLVQTFLYLLRVGLAYLVMLALMSFNGGVFLVAVFAHAIGFFFFRSRAFAKTRQNDNNHFDDPPMSC
ncbi:hypothetical protein PIB30_016082 [Stylosanthes scabra]|uniref:Copper transport protein n=1 Tax=Stylosanthes scabra TaxID=79078 RepID=A0ABU6Z4T3_9FABA|nr:hypothetical protein [Stylosanthes scabra]